jgi:hypothetical protein
VLEVVMEAPAGVIDALELRYNESMTPAGSDIGEYYQTL